MNRERWENDKLLAMAILRDRKARRKWLTTFAVCMLVWMALGLWVIDEWLGESIIRFGVYWLLCALLTFFVIIFALFDALVAIREERDKHNQKRD